MRVSARSLREVLGREVLGRRGVGERCWGGVGGEVLGGVGGCWWRGVGWQGFIFTSFLIIEIGYASFLNYRNFGSAGS